MGFDGTVNTQPDFVACMRAVYEQEDDDLNLYNKEGEIHALGSDSSLLIPTAFLKSKEAQTWIFNWLNSVAYNPHVNLTAPKLVKSGGKDRVHTTRSLSHKFVSDTWLMMIS